MNSRKDQTIISEVRDHVMGLLKDHLSEKLTYHSNGHTLYVFESATHIAEKSDIDEHSLMLLKIAALFHDVGYIRSYDEHEKHSAAMAAEFLAFKGLEKEDIETICNAILATAIPQKPGDVVSAILCDADLMHLSAIDYFDKTTPIMREWANIGKARLTEPEFLKTSLAFFNAHRYHTSYGREILAPLKESNRQRIIEKLMSKGNET